jgi:hypothetical protein
MDASLAKMLMDDVVRLNLEISDMKRDHDALQKKHTELLKDHERVSNLLEMYCAEARREIEKKEFNIVDAVVSASVVGGAAAAVAASENVIVNNDASEDKTVTLDPIESKKAKRKAYMRAYMKMKRDVKGDE